MATKSELRAKADELCKLYNDAVQSGDFKASTKVNDDMVNVVNEYTALSRHEVFEELKNTGKPMLEAVKRLTFPTIKIKDTKQGDEKIPVRIIDDIEKPIDVLKLQTFVGSNIGTDEKWHNMIEKFNFLMTARKALALKLSPDTVNSSYAMSNIAREINMGGTPTSNTAMLKLLQSIVTAMLGDEYKASSHDVAFLDSVWSKKDRAALTVSCANHKYMRMYMAEICHRIVLGLDYKLAFKTTKA